MNSEIISSVTACAEKYGCTVLYDVSLSSYTTMGVGGSCPVMAEINSEDALCGIIRHIRKNYPDVPYYVIGKGSNLIVSDKGADMIFLHMGSAFNDITVKDNTVICKAGASMAAAACTARDSSLTGMEFAHGIPGSIGGGVYMNAGAYGGELKDIIVYAKAADREGNIHTFTKDEMKLSYRHSIFSKNSYIITEAAFLLDMGDRDCISAKMSELAAKRREKQPLEYRSSGSTFKRPEGAFAAALIEQCGLKGYTVGGAQVSGKHSGFVINKGDASFSDIMAVIEHVKAAVEAQTGYRLECEPEIIGL